MALDYKELEDLIIKITDFISNKIVDLNRTSELDEYLIKIGYTNRKNHFEITKGIKKQSKILIIGESMIKEKNIIAIFEDAGISRSRLELVLDYDKAGKYNYSKLEYNDDYGVVLFGPIPHSVEGKEKYNSIINKMEDNYSSYPPVIRLESGKQIKITKSNLEEAIDKLIENNIVIPNLSFK